MGTNGTAIGVELKDGRKHRRKPVLWPARLETDAGTIDCVAFDLSRGGAKLRLQAPLALRRPVRLMLERFGTVRAEAIWRRRDRVGLRFTETPETVAMIFGGALPL